MEKRAVRYDAMRCPQHGKEDEPNRTYQLGRDCKLSRAVAPARLRAALEAELLGLTERHGGLCFFGRARSQPPPYHWLVLVEGVPFCHVGAACMPAISARALVWRLRDALRAAGLDEATASHYGGNVVVVRGGPGRPIALHKVGGGGTAWLCCADTKAASWGSVERGGPAVSMGASNALVYGGSGNANRMLYIVNAASRAPRPPEVRPADGTRRDHGFLGTGLSSLACDVNRYRVPQRSDEASCLGVPMWVVFSVARKAEVLDSTLVSPEAARRLGVKALAWRRAQELRALYDASTMPRLAPPTTVASSIAGRASAARPKRSEDGGGGEDG